MSYDEFGSYRLLIDTASIVAPGLLFGLQYTWMQTIAASCSKIDQARQKAAILLLNVSLVVITILIGKLLLEPLSLVFNFGNYSTLVPYLFVICIPLFRDMVEGVLVAQARFLELAFAMIVPQILMLILVICFLPVPTVATVSVVAGLTIVVCTLFSMILTGVSFHSFGNTMLLILKANKHIGLPIYISGWIALMGRNILQLLTGTRLDYVEYGNLSLALMFAGLFSLIPSAISKVKFRDFAVMPRISRRVFTGAAFSMLIFSGIMLIIAYIYVLFLAKEKYGVLLQFLPLLLLGTAFQGLGDITGRFFLAKGKGSVVARISLIVGVFNLASGVVLIQLFGVWGVIAERTSTSILFWGLNYIEYKKLSGC